MKQYVNNKPKKRLTFTIVHRSILVPMQLTKRGQYTPIENVYINMSANLQQKNKKNRGQDMLNYKD